MKDIDKEIYVLLMLNYKKKHPNQDNIFPSNWENDTNYKLKSLIINEAINNDILIKDTTIYKENM